MNNLMNIATDILPQYDEIMDRQREAKEMEAEKRDQQIESLADEKFRDTGEFVEFIQSIEVSEDNLPFFERWHREIMHYGISGIHIEDLFMQHCMEKAEREVDE